MLFLQEAVHLGSLEAEALAMSDWLRDGDGEPEQSDRFVNMLYDDMDRMDSKYVAAVADAYTRGMVKCRQIHAWFYVNDECMALELAHATVRKRVRGLVARTHEVASFDDLPVDVKSAYL